MKELNSMKVRGGLLLGVGLLFCQATAVLGAQPTPFSVSLGFDFASGDYGTGQTTESTRIPLTIGYASNDRLDFELVIPYIYQNNDSTVNLGGIRFPRHDSGMADAGTGGMGGTGGMDGGTVTSNDSQSGLGDSSLTAGYILRHETESTPMFRPLVYVKMPTGDEDKGLGSGAFDFGGGLSVGKGFGDWFTYVEAMYVVPGTTSSFNPEDYWTYLMSASYSLTERLAYGVDLAGATAAFDGGDDALYVEFNVNYWTSQQGSIGGYVAKGLSDSTADYMIGLSGTIIF